MRRAGSLFLLLLASPVLLAAWQWPLETPTMVAAFAQSRAGTYLRGVEIAGDGSEVYPVANGTVVYVGDLNVPGVPSQLGSLVVVDHARGFRSYYGFLAPGDLPEPGSAVTGDTVIGTAGHTGIASGGIYLAIQDTGSGDFINPDLLLPDRPDDVSPSIYSVLARRESALYDLDTETGLPAGRYELVVNCADRSRDGDAPVAPYSMSILVDGHEAMTITHDRIAVAGGVVRLQPGPDEDHDVLRTTDGEYLCADVDIPVGTTVIEVIVSDIRGNSTSVVRNVTGVE